MSIDTKEGSHNPVATREGSDAMRPSREEHVTGAAGLRLFLRSWTPAGQPRAVVVIMHGFLSHGGFYEWAAGQLVVAGFAVYAHDLRGHGRSEGDRFWVDKFSDYLTDLEVVVALARSRHPKIPCFVLGHSVGGVIASLYTSEHPDTVAGLVSESFAFELPAPDFALAALRGLDHLAPHTPVLSLKPEDFSRDPAVVEALRTDPLVTHTPGPTHTLAEIARADERLRNAFPSITTPVLILHGTADRAAKPHGSKRFFESVGSVDKKLEMYEGFFHDLLNDVGKEGVMADIVAWLRDRSTTR
jgi:alpha-beta hydrolase superfamily lysophospholipase